MTSTQFPFVGARLPLKALYVITCLVLFLFVFYASAQQNPQYGSMRACHNMQVGTPTFGPNGGDLNGFVPFPATNLWNTNIANAPLDPNNAALTAVWAAAGGYKLHPVFGESPAFGGIPYIVVDSTRTPSVPINVIDYATESDVVVAPYPGGDAVPIEDDESDCASWPDTYIGDAHTLVLDRATCWLYETGETSRCNGQFNAMAEAIWDMIKNDSRPWGWTGASVSNTSLFAGLLRYDEAASGVINHALSYTMSPTEGDDNGGYFVLPAAHASSSKTTANLLPMGTRIRLRASTDISSFSPTNQVILTALKQCGMILAENGSNLFMIGTTDPRWDDADTDLLKQIKSADFDVVQMTPEYPGMDSVTALTDYPGTVPVINSFTASATHVTPGTPVIFNFSVTGDSYDYIDNIGPVRLRDGRGSVEITPWATQTYTLYAVNASAVNNAIQNTPITVIVAGSKVVPPVFTPPGGWYASNTPLSITLSTRSANEDTATFYYTTDGTVPTTNSTQYIGVACSNSGPACNANPDNGSITPITVSSSGTLKAIAIVPGYAKPSEVSTAHYTIGTADVTDTPVFSLAPGIYFGTQTVYLSDATNGTDGNGNSIYYTTDGTTPTTNSVQFSNPSCYDCTGAGPITVSQSETIKAIAVAAGYNNSAVAKAEYIIVPLPF